MSLVTERIVRKKLSDEVFARLKQLIENGELKAGDDMPSERELFEQRVSKREQLLAPLMHHASHRL